MRGFSKACCFLAVVLTTACAQQEPQVESHDFSHLLARGVSRGLPGMWLAVGTVDGLDWAGAAGFSSLDGPVEAELDNAVHMASITKSLTAVAVLQLVDAGELSLDARVVELLPDDAVGRIPHIEEITVEQLLDHSSGIYGFNNNSEYLSSLVGPNANNARAWSNLELVGLSYETVNEPFGMPGEGSFYGDTNYVLLGLIVEEVTGRPLKEVVAASLLTPVGLGATYYLSDYREGGAMRPGNPARGYLRLSPELMSVVPVHEKFSRVQQDLADTTAAGETIDAAAGMVTTITDLHAFGRALFGGALLQPMSQAWLMAVGEGLDVPGSEPERVGALRGYRRAYGVVLAAEGDGPGGSNTILAYHPETGVIVAAMTNVHGLWFENAFFLDEVIGEVVRVYRREATPGGRAAAFFHR